MNAQLAIPLPIIRALQVSCQQLNIEPRRTVIVFDQPLVGDMPLQAYYVATFPGQTISIATGMAIANPALRIFAVIDALNECSDSLSSLMESAEQNQNMTVILRHHSTGDSWLAAFLDRGASFIARGFVGDVLQLQKIITSATRHDGLAIVEIIEPDANSAHTYAWYRQNLEYVKTPTNKEMAWRLLQQSGERFPAGIIYQKRQSSFQTQLLKRISSPLVDQSLKNINIKPLLKDLE